MIFKTNMLTANTAKGFFLIGRKMATCRQPLAEAASSPTNMDVSEDVLSIYTVVRSVGSIREKEKSLCVVSSSLGKLKNKNGQ